MAKRILMNSKSLKTSFPHIYKIFFLKCPLVVSAPGNFFWTGEYASLFGGFSIKQNLPLRVYVGLEPSNTFSIGPIKSLLPFQQVFKSWKFPPLMEKKIASLLRKKAREEKIKINFKIRMIFELPPGCGLSVSSAYALALACALFLASGKISPQEINRWRHSNGKELNKDQRFLKIFHLALELEKIAAPESATGSGIMCSLKASPYPQIFFFKKEKNFSIGIDEITGQKFVDWPFDFGLIYSGEAVGPKEVSWPARKSHLRESAEIWRKFTNALKLKEPPVYRKRLSTKKLLLSYINAIKVINLEVLKGLIKFLSEGFSEETARYFFKTINTNHKLLDALWASNSLLDEICFWINQKTKEKGDALGGGCKLISVGHRGDILFVTNWYSLREHIFELIEELKNKISKNILLHYASWLDGIEEEGLKIEQYLAKEIYSQFISSGALLLTLWTYKGEKQCRLITLEHFKKRREKIDLLIDTIENKIYLKGSKMTSQELPSSSTTIEILNILLENMGKEVPNFKFPLSSYATNRNEMQSKIISPLQKALKRKVGKRIPLKIYGGLTNFYVQLEPSALDIETISKIF